MSFPQQKIKTSNINKKEKKKLNGLYFCNQRKDKNLKRERGPGQVGSVGAGGGGRAWDLIVSFRQKAEDVFTYTQEIDHLGNAKKRCNDQGATVGPLQESWGTLILEDFAKGKQDVNVIKL